MKIARTCEPVRTTVGNTSTGGLTTGARSSRISQEMLPSTMSAFAKYGKKELLAKSASPNTTSRNGLPEPKRPSDAAASGIAPRGAPAASSLALRRSVTR